MSKPTPANLHKKELKRKAERKRMRMMSVLDFMKRKMRIKAEVKEREECQSKKK